MKRTLLLSILWVSGVVAQPVVSTFLGGGASTAAAGDGLSFNSQANFHTMTVAPNGVLYVARVNPFNDIIAVGREGGYRIMAGSGSTTQLTLPPGQGTPATGLKFQTVDAIAAAPNGHLFAAVGMLNGVTGQLDRFIIRIEFPDSAANAFRVAGGGQNTGDGAAATSFRVTPVVGLAASATELFFSPGQSTRVFSVNLSTNVVTTAAGTAVAGNSGDGLLGVQALLNQPSRLLVDGGFLHILSGNTCSVRRLDLATRIMSTLPGTQGEPCGGQFPQGIAAHQGGILLLRSGRIVRISGGAESPFAGNGSLGDPASEGLLATQVPITPTSIAADPGANRVYHCTNRVRAIYDPSEVKTVRLLPDFPIDSSFSAQIDGAAALSAGLLPASVHSMSVPESFPISGTSRRRFASYSANGQTVLPRTFNYRVTWAPEQNILVQTVRQFQVTAAVGTPGGGRVLVRVGNGPAQIVLTERANFFDEDTVVTLTAEPAAGFQFGEYVVAPRGENPLNVTVRAGRTLTARFEAINGFTPIRINAGGPQFNDSLGQIWAADQPSPLDISTTEQIGGPDASAIYQTARRGTLITIPATGAQVASNPRYTFSVPNGNYNLRLKFADFQSTAAGQRRVNIVVNGATLLSNFDIFAEAGGRSRALDKLFAVSTNTGQIAVEIARSVGDPMVNALQLISGAVGVTVSPANVVLSGGQTVSFVSTVAGSENRDVTWTIAPEAGSISADGVYTAPASIEGRQTVTVTATSKADPTRSALAVVSLSPPWTAGSAEGWLVSHQPLSGDGSVVAHVSAAEADPDRETGVIIRESLEAGAPWVFAGVRGGSTAVVRARTAAGSEERFMRAGSGMNWVRVVRAGSTITAYHSLDGVTWNEGASFDVAMKADVVAGLAASSGAAPAESESVDSASISSAVSVSVAHGAGSAASGQVVKLDAAVTGSSDSGVSYSMTPTFGELTQGEYRAPVDAADAPRTVTITARSNADRSKTATSVLRVGRFEALAINAGGTAENVEDLGVFTTDRGFTGGRAELVAAAETLPAIYRTARFGANPFEYRLLVPAGGAYVARLRFIEPEATGAGQRVFHVTVNGRRVVEALDVFARAGGAGRELSIAVPVSAEDGEVRIGFVPVTGEAMVSAIEILE